MTDAAVSLRDIRKEYRRADFSIVALEDINIDIPEGEFFLPDGTVRIREVDTPPLGSRNRPAHGRGNPRARRRPQRIEREPAGRLAQREHRITCSRRST